MFLVLEDQGGVSWSFTASRSAWTSFAMSSYYLEWPHRDFSVEGSIGFTRGIGEGKGVVRRHVGCTAEVVLSGKVIYMSVE